MGLDTFCPNCHASNPSDSKFCKECGTQLMASEGQDASFTKTLLGALKQGGGGQKALGRHATAALLNAAHPEVSFAYTEAQVISIVQGAYFTGEYESAKNSLEWENEMGCPLGKKK